MPKLGNAERAHLLGRLERLHTFLDQLDAMKSDFTRLRDVRKLMRRELMAAKKEVKTLRLRDRGRSKVKR